MGSKRERAAVDLQSLRRSCADCSLRTLCLPAGVELDELDRLEEVVQRLAPLEPHQGLYRMGDPFRSIFVIRSGSLKTVRFESEEGQQILGFHLPGEVVGLDGMADDRHHCDALALERTSVCAVTMDTLERTAAQLPSLQRQLHRIMGREMGHDQAHVAAMGRRSARERLALFLYDLSQRMVQSGQSGLAFRLPMSRDDLANYLGLALETVSRLFNQLADEGIITIDRRRIRIDRPEALTELAGMSEDRPSERSSTS